ncbi:MAG: cobaltochelatase subunit CobT, partial [Alphaproteobacteria bacterium]
MSAKTTGETFRRALSAATRALADRPGLKVSFGPERPHVSGDEAHLKAPPPRLAPDDVAVLRGQADGLAMRLRFHNTDLHRSHAPSGMIARAVYDRLEQTRVEVLGARMMAGVRDNLAQALDRHCREIGLDRVSEPGDVPLAEALSLRARERMAGEPVPSTARRALD